MSRFDKETVTEVTHWNETLFSFKTTRPRSLRFHNGHFVMMGLEVEDKPLVRAYSIASPNYDEHLEFLSIKVPDGPLTSKLQKIGVGDQVLIGKKPVGTLVISDLLPGDNLYLFATGTGLAPFMSIIQDVETYEKFKKVTLVHSVRYVSELAYKTFISDELKAHPYIAEYVDNQLVYFPTVTREQFENTGRMTDLIRTGELVRRLNMPPLNPDTDRAMICGGPSMLQEMCNALEQLGFKASKHIGDAADYVIERAFVE